MRTLWVEDQMAGVLVNFAFQTTTVAGPLIPPDLSWHWKDKTCCGAVRRSARFSSPLSRGRVRKPHDVDNFRSTWHHMIQHKCWKGCEFILVHVARTKEWCLKMSANSLAWLLFPGIFNWKGRSSLGGISTVFASPFSSEVSNVTYEVVVVDMNVISTTPAHPNPTTQQQKWKWCNMNFWNYEAVWAA